MKNTWRGINGFIGNGLKSTKVTKLETGDTIFTDPVKISDVLNAHISEINFK